MTNVPTMLYNFRRVFFFLSYTIIFIFPISSEKQSLHLGEPEITSFQIRRTRDQIPELPLGCGTLDMSLKLSETQFLHLLNMYRNTCLALVNLVTVCQGLNRSHNTHIQTPSLIRTMQGRYSYTCLIDEETESQRV